MKKPRTIADLKADPRVAELYKEEGNGWWLYLAPGYVIENCGNLSSIHEMTIKDVCNVLHNEVIAGDPYADEEEYAANTLIDHITHDHESAPTDPLPSTHPSGCTPVSNPNALTIPRSIPQPPTGLRDTLATFESWCNHCTRAIITAVVVTYWLGYHTGQAVHRLNDHLAQRRPMIAGL